MTTLLKMRPALAGPGNWQLNSLLKAAEPNDLAILVKASRTRRVSPGEELIVAGVRNDDVFFPETAILSHVYITEGGGSVEASLIGPEGASGLSAVFERKAPRHLARVTIGGDVTCVRASALAAPMGVSNSLRSKFCEYLASQTTETGQRLACSIFHLAEERFCTWLLMLRDRGGSNRMRVTHEEIANLLGVNRTSISSIAKRLKDKGLVAYTRGKLQILDVEALRAAACDCSSSWCDTMRAFDAETLYARNSVA